MDIKIKIILYISCIMALLFFNVLLFFVGIGFYSVPDSGIRTLF